MTDDEIRKLSCHAPNSKVIRQVYGSHIKKIIDNGHSILYSNKHAFVKERTTKMTRQIQEISINSVKKVLLNAQDKNQLTDAQNMHGLRNLLHFDLKQKLKNVNITDTATCPQDIEVKIREIDPLPAPHTKGPHLKEELRKLDDLCIHEAFPKITEKCNALKIIMDAYLDQNFGNKSEVQKMWQKFLSKQNELMDQMAEIHEFYTMLH